MVETKTNLFSGNFLFAAVFALHWKLLANLIMSLKDRGYEVRLRHFLGKTKQVHQRPFRKVMQCIALPGILNKLFLLRYVERNSVGVCFQTNLFLSSVF